ncbi:capsule biosynthesis protein [Falsiroseomonas sp. CW058]|uniref:capsule biosynthesis protein n=1 Tax=Falsiroseomonas sp. CW058 TaxID=3388664 RepID=UPI003D31DC76
MPAAPAAVPLAAPRPRRRRLGTLGWFALLVLLPTLLVGAYYATVAADLFESEARFQVRGRGPSSSSSGAGALAGMMGGGIPGALRPGGEEAQAVAQFVDSFDAVAGLRRTLDLVGVWRRPEADPLSMLWWEEPEAERLLRYYRRRVKLDYDIETGVSTLRVQAFRPADAQQVAQELLRMAEELVNRFSQRSIQDQLRVARQDVATAEARVLAARDALAAFREREQALDPTRSAGAALETISRLEAALAQARAELQERRAFMRPDNPQIQVLTNRISALQAQIAVERGRTTRGDEALTQQVAGYERLQLEREFADRQLASATASLEQARSDALRQQVFLMRVAEPHLPERALYPKGLFNTLTVLVGLSVLFGICWLLVAGAREHAS